MKLQVSKQKYARVLRAVGYDLADLFPENFEIEFRDNEYVARGHSRANLGKCQDKDEKPSGVRNLLHKFGGSSAKAGSLSTATVAREFVRTYTAADIIRLDESGAARRKGTSEKPDLYSLEERLRMIGRIADEKKIELLKLSQDSNVVTFQYRDENGQTHSDSCSTLQLYKLQQDYYSGRRVSLLDPWQGIRE